MNDVKLKLPKNIEASTMATNCSNVIIFYLSYIALVGLDISDLYRMGESLPGKGAMQKTDS